MTRFKRSPDRGFFDVTLKLNGVAFGHCDHVDCLRGKGPLEKRLPIGSRFRVVECDLGGSV